MLVLAGLGAAVLLAAGYVLQQHEAAEIPDGGLSPQLLLALARRPVWLGGIGAMIAGQVLGAVALGLGSLVVVEPLLSANVLFALPLAAFASRRHLAPGDWIGAVLLIGGLAMFLAGAAPRTDVDDHSVSALAWVVAGGTLFAVLATILLLTRGRGPRTRAALLAIGAGSIFGMQDFLTQRSILRLENGVLGLLTSWVPWVLICVAVAGLTFAQRAFGIADLSASLPAITLAEPVVGIALSIGALGQGLPREPLPLGLGICGLGLMVAGVVMLTRSPLVVDPHGKRPRHLHRPEIHLHPHMSGSHRAHPRPPGPRPQPRRSRSSSPTE